MKYHKLAAILAAILMTASIGTTAFADGKVIKKAVAAQTTGVEEDDTEAAKDEKISFSDEMAALINKNRVKAGLKELTHSAGLDKVATTRAKELLESYSHTRPNGGKSKTAMDDAGISYSNWGENIHEKQKTASGAMAAWMKSAGHKANILSADFTAVGIGRAKDSEGSYYYVQIFAELK